MRYFLTILAALLLIAAPVAAQTIKSIGFNTTNGQVVANTGTNVLTFTNNINVNDTTITGAGLSWGTVPRIDLEQGALVDEANTVVAAWGSNSVYFSVPIDWAGPSQKFTTRANLGLGLPLLTNTSITNFQAALFSTNTAPTNTTNVSAWTTIQIGTNAFRVPLYQ